MNMTPDDQDYQMLRARYGQRFLDRIQDENDCDSAVGGSPRVFPNRIVGPTTQDLLRAWKTGHRS